MSKIAKLLKMSVINIKRKKEKYEESSYLIRTNKIESKNQLFTYLDKFWL